MEVKDAHMERDELCCGQGRCLSPINLSMPCPLLISDVITSYINWQIGRGLSQGSIRNIKLAMRRLNSHKPLTEWAIEDVELVVMHGYSHLSSSTLRQRRSIWRGFWDWCRRHEVLTFEKASLFRDLWEVPRSKKRMRLLIHLSLEEEDRLCSVSRKNMVRYIRLSIALGFRVRTMYALRWAWLDGDVLRIPADAMKSREPLIYLCTARVLDLMGERGKPNDPIIETPSWGNIRRGLASAARRAGLSIPIGPHTLRRTWCLRCREAGISREEARELQGWSDAAVLLNHYWPKQDIDEKRLLVSKMENHVFSLHGGSDAPSPLTPTFRR